MRYLAFATAALLAAPAAHAWEPITEPAPMLYLSVPLDASRKSDEGTRYGLALTESRVDLRTGTESVSLTPERPALLDYSFNAGTGLPSLKIHGVEAMRYTTVLHADGTSETAAEGINWWVVGGIVVAAGVIVENQDDDDDDNTSGGPGFGGGPGL